MFHLVHRTWNPITGCLHLCRYCWARRLVETRLRFRTRKYRDGFKPIFHPEELKRRFKPNEFVFCCDVGDAFGDWVPRDWILKVLQVVRRYPKTTFLFLTKNPARYLEFIDEFRGLGNVILGATIETDLDHLYYLYRISGAPDPTERFRALLKVRELGFRVMVSIEPVIKFNLHNLYLMMVELEPEFIYIGYDNYGNKLPEPPLSMVLRLIKALRSHGITVYEKTLRKAWYEP